MKALKLIISYDGTHYLGWQKTKEGPSIEETLETVLSRILQHPVKLEAASRTDAGVHAHGQVARFTTTKDLVDLKKLQLSLNQLLPTDITVTDVAFVSDTFHPTLDAKSKTYEYRVSTGPFLCPFKRQTYWHFPKSLDLAKMKLAANYLIGYHDFKAFTNDREPVYQDTHRELYEISITQSGDDYLFSIKGHHFLYKMVRNIVGTLVYVGANKLAPEDIPHILASKSRPLAGVTAPSQGLILASIEYKKTSWDLKDFIYIRPFSTLGAETGGV